METVQVRQIVGVEAERIRLKSAALRVIREMLERPLSADRNVRKDWLSPPPLSAFSHLEPLGFGLDKGDWWIFRPEDCKPDLVWPVSVGIVAERGGSGELTFSRMRTVSAKEVRGYATRFSPFMVRMDHGQVIDGRLVTCAGLYSWLGGRWIDAQTRTIWGGREGKETVERLGMETKREDGNNPLLLTSVALRQRYEWAVSFSLPKSPSVRFATDPTGIKEMFRLRDIPEGKDRRDALLTWVSDHWRQSRNDPEVEIYVRKHLRGALKFEWAGLESEIVPSQFDIEKRDALIADREAMRRDGVDKRQFQFATA